MKVVDKIALVLIIIGAINWGLIGFFKFNLVDTIFGSMSVISRIIYALVGISGIWGIKLLIEKVTPPTAFGKGGKKHEKILYSFNILYGNCWSGRMWKQL